MGLAFGPVDIPTELFTEFGSTIYTTGSPQKLLADLEAARQVHARIFVSFTGSFEFNRDANGFSFTKWKQRVDRYRGIDLTPFIADGTILGHALMDEPQDPTNWNGKPVTPAEIEAMAEYSKQVWPTMETMIRAFPAYLAGHQYPHLDAARVQYIDSPRFRPIEDFIAINVAGAKALGLELVTGLNVLNGGDHSSGIPGRREGKSAMSADELRRYGSKLLAEPHTCAFLMWEYDPKYFSRPDIQAAVSDLKQIARTLPEKTCRP